MKDINAAIELLSNIAENLIFYYCPHAASHSPLHIDITTADNMLKGDYYIDSDNNDDNTSKIIMLYVKPDLEDYAKIFDDESANFLDHFIELTKDYYEQTITTTDTGLILFSFEL